LGTDRIGGGSFEKRNHRKKETMDFREYLNVSVENLFKRSSG